MEKLVFSSIRKIRIKIQNTYFQCKGSFIEWYIQKENELKTQIIITFKHISSLITLVPKFLLFRNEEKLVGLLVYSTFIRVATSGF